MERGGRTPLAPGAVTGISGPVGRYGCGPLSRRNQGEAEIPSDFRARMLVRDDRESTKYRAAPNDCGFFFFNYWTQTKTHPKHILRQNFGGPHRCHRFRCCFSLLFRHLLFLYIYIYFLMHLLFFVRQRENDSFEGALDG